MPSAIETSTILARSVAEGKPVSIKGYRSDSGEVIDYVVRVIGRTGYMNLVNFARQALLKSASMMVDPIEKQAASELLTSWGNTLAGKSGGRNFGEQLSDADISRGWTVIPGEHGVALFHVQVEKKDVLTPSEKQTKSSDKTLAKKKLTDNSPLGVYLGRLNLYPGKFDSITIIS